MWDDEELMAGAQEEHWDSPRKDSRMEPYEGTLGRTRTEPVQVWMPDGSIRALSVYVGVDAVTDPALATLARAGTLHHVADGVELAIAHTYHDRQTRTFVLVVPEALRHRALSLRAEHMALVAVETQHAVPEYVRAAEVVIGARGLRARLEAGQPTASLHQEVLEPGSMQRALVARERELTRRERLLRAREEALRELRQRPDRPSLGTVDDSELEEVVDTDADYTTLDAVEASAAELSAAVPFDAPDDEGDDALEAGDESLEEVEDLEGADALDVDDDPEPEELGEPSDYPPEALVEAAMMAPEAFVADTDSELWLTENDGRVWLFVRHRPSPPRDRAPMELLLQLDPGAEPPVALVTLIFDVEGSPEVRRGAIDPADPAQVRALAHLSESFEVELVSIAGPHDFEHWASLSVRREANARAVLGRLTRKEQLDPERFAAARDHLLRAPPPWRERSHPFQPHADRSAPANATEAAVQLDDLAAWLVPERRERVRLLWSVPDDLVDEYCVRCLGAALDWGLSLSGPLSARAISLAVAQDQRSLLARRIHGLCRASLAEDYAGLEAGVLRTLWSEALEQAARLGVSLPDQARELAREHAGERALIHASALSDSAAEALEPLRQKALAPTPDVAALEELLARGAHPDLVAGCRVAARLPPEVAGALFAHVALREDPVALDALLSLLALREEPLVRVGAALALGQRRAVHALDELALNLARTDLPAWRLFALALGRYGGGSFRAVARAMAGQSVDTERVTLVYALLCCHGARAQLKAKARASGAADAQLAERALSLAHSCRTDETALLALEDEADLTVFCKIFDRTCGAAHA